MSLGLADLMDVACSHAQASGWFDQVTGHEPKNLPGGNLACAIWVDEVRPIPASGLAATSALVVLAVRLSTPMLAEPQDEIDPTLLSAADALLAAYSGDFTFGGLVRAVDLLGAHGVALRGKAGYLNQDGVILRVFQITLPLIVNDLWAQAE